MRSFKYTSVVPETSINLGDSVELSLAVDDLPGAESLLQDLGFQESRTLDLPYPATAYTDGSIKFALHQAQFPSPTLTFFGVKIDQVEAHLNAHGHTVQELQRENGQATAISCRAPGNLRLVLASAYPTNQTFTDTPSRCGTFVEFALPVDDIDEALEFWSNVSFHQLSGNTDPYRHAQLSDGQITLGLHETSDLERPACIFRTNELDAVAAELRASGTEILERSKERAAALLPSHLLLILATS